MFLETYIFATFMLIMSNVGVFLCFFYFQSVIQSWVMMESFMSRQSSFLYIERRYLFNCMSYVLVNKMLDLICKERFNVLGSYCIIWYY